MKNKGSGAVDHPMAPDLGFNENIGVGRWKIY